VGGAGEAGVDCGGLFRALEVMNDVAKTGSGSQLARKLSYACKCLPGYAWQRLSRRTPRGQVHLMITLADHFEPSSLPGNNAGYAPRHIQETRLETWCEEYPRNFEAFRDNEGQRFTHTYFYPAEQYDRDLVARLAELCYAGWGEIEIHLHHGLLTAETAETTRRELVAFRDILAREHNSLSYTDGDSTPKYVFVHGNFALANCAGGYACGVDSEMQVLAETGCYADMTYPTSAFHPAQIVKINSLYECGGPLDQAAPQRRGRNLRAGRPVAKFPFIIQGPWMVDFDRASRTGLGRIENGALTHVNPPSLRRLRLWKQAGVSVIGRPDWIFVKLHTHGMDPTQTETVLRAPMQRFLGELISNAPGRGEILHFVSAREMANIALAACDGREGNPGDYRDYRYRRARTARPNPPVVVAGMAVRS
jgi:hypothetical protein